MNGSRLRPVLQVAMRRLEDPPIGPGKLPKAKPMAKAVLLILAAHAHDDGTDARPSAPTIAAELGISQSSVDRALAWLRSKGLIRQATGAYHHSNPVYDLDLERLATLPPVRASTQVALRPAPDAPLGLRASTQTAHGLAHRQGRASSDDAEGLAHRQTEEDQDLEVPMKNPQEEEHAVASAPALPSHRDVLRILEARFIERTGLPNPSPITDRQRREYGVRWANPLREIAGLVDWDQDRALQLLDATVTRMQTANLTVCAPGSILNNAKAIMAEDSRGAYYPDGHSRGVTDLARRINASEVIDAQEAD